MLIKYKERYRVPFRIISLAIVCLFICNDIALALAPNIRSATPAFKSEYAIGYSILAHKAVNNYIKGVLKNDDSRTDGLFIEVPGLLKNTGQIAHIGLGRSYGRPVIYIGTKYFYNEAVRRHELNKIEKWESKRKSLGRTFDQMREWILGSETQADARKFSGSVDGDTRPSVKNIYAGIKGYVDLDNIYTLYCEYGLDKDDSDINIAAHVVPSSYDSEVVPASKYPKLVKTGLKAAIRSLSAIIKQAGEMDRIIEGSGTERRLSVDKLKAALELLNTADASGVSRQTFEDFLSNYKSFDDSINPAMDELFRIKNQKLTGMLPKSIAVMHNKKLRIDRPAAQRYLLSQGMAKSSEYTSIIADMDRARAMFQAIAKKRAELSLNINVLYFYLVAGLHKEEPDFNIKVRASMRKIASQMSRKTSISRKKLHEKLRCEVARVVDKIMSRDGRQLSMRKAAQSIVIRDAERFFYPELSRILISVEQDGERLKAIGEQLRLHEIGKNGRALESLFYEIIDVIDRAYLTNDERNVKIREFAQNLLYVHRGLLSEIPVFRPELRWRLHNWIKKEDRLKWWESIGLLLGELGNKEEDLDVLITFFNNTESLGVRAQIIVLYLEVLNNVFSENQQLSLSGISEHVDRLIVAVNQHTYKDGKTRDAIVGYMNALKKYIFAHWNHWGKLHDGKMTFLHALMWCKPYFDGHIHGDNYSSMNEPNAQPGYMTNSEYEMIQLFRSAMPSGILRSRVSRSTVTESESAATDKPMSPDMAKEKASTSLLTDDKLDGLVRDRHFIDLFKLSTDKSAEELSAKILKLMKGAVPEEGLTVLKYDDATLLVIYKDKKPYRVVRYAVNSYVDYLSGPRLNADERHSANMLDNGFKLEILRDRPEVLAGYLEDIDMYYDNPVLRPIVDNIWTGEYYNLREAIEHLKSVVNEFSGSTDDSGKKIRQYALKLFHTLMYHDNKGIRIEANRALHDIYTERPSSFPATKSYKTVLQGEDQRIEVSCRNGERAAMLQWSLNGKLQTPIVMTKTSGINKFTAVIPVAAGTIHYAIEVNVGGVWRYKVGGPREEQVSGVIKTQKDMRGKHVLEVRTAIFDLPKDKDGKPVWDKDGSLKISNLDQLRVLLPELKKQYDAIWLMDCFEWGPVRWPGRDPSSFAPLDHVTVAGALGGEEALERLKAEADSGEKKMDLILNLIPHISQSNTTLPAYFPAYRYNGTNLVRRDSSDGLGDWDDSFQPNWRRKEVMDWYLSLVRRFALKGYSFRADVAHAFDTTFKVDDSARGLAQIFGDIVSNDRRDNGDGSFKTTDLSGTGEPNVILSRLAYEIQANAPNSLIYGENFATKTEDRGWQANDERLIKSGVVPYNSLHEELAHVLRDSKDISGIINHILYRQWIHDRFGGQDVTVYSSHDYQRDPQIPDEIYKDRPPLQLYGDGIIPFMATIFLLDYHGPILWHFARLLGDESDDFNKRHNLSLAEFWKIWVNNIREFNYDGSVRASVAFLKDNPNLALLGDHVLVLKKILEEYDVMKSSDVKLVRHDSDCMSVLKSNGEEAILGFVNYGYHNKNIFRPIPELPELEDGQVYELKELFRYRKDSGFSKSPALYLSGAELRNLGIHEQLFAWETIIYSIKPIRIESYSLDTLRRSMANYKNFGVEDRVKYSLVSHVIRSTIENDDFDKFKDILVKLIKITRHTGALELGEVSTVLYDISRFHTNLKGKIVDNLTRIALEKSAGPDMDVRYDIVKILRGMQIGEVAIASLETRDIAGLGGLALYAKDIAIAFVDLGLDTTIFTNLFNYNREGVRIFESILHSAHLTYTGKSVTVPFYGEDADTQDRFNRAYIYETMLGKKVRTYALHNDRYGNILYGGFTAEDLVRRYRFFALGALEAMRTMNVHPAVLQTNEGATGLAIPYLASPGYGYLAGDGHFKSLRVTVHANHNLDHNYQNIITGDNVAHKKHLMRIAGFNPESFEDHMLFSADAKSLELNPSYAANTRSDYSVTVSPGYRDYTADNSADIGLGDLMRSKRDNDRYMGEQNGIDTVTWQKRILREQTFFECKDADGRRKLFQRVKNNIKPAAKNELQEKLGLPKDPNACLFTMLHRLCEQKGYEIAINAIKELLDNNPDAQVVIGGPAENSDKGRSFKREIEDTQNDARYNGRFKYVGGVNPDSRLYELMYLGADIFLMPSKFEPAGLSQLEALAAGAVVVARDVDGLSTSIVDITEDAGKDMPASGFKFFDFTSSEFRAAMERALGLFRERHVSAPGAISEWDQLSYNALTCDSRWIRPAKKYISDIFAKKTGVDMERTADFPELLLIFSEAEICRDEWTEPESRHNLERRLIEYGYNTDRGLDHVVEDAVMELKKIVDDESEKRGLVRLLAEEYYEKYKNVLSGKPFSADMAKNKRPETERQMTKREIRAMIERGLSYEEAVEWHRLKVEDGVYFPARFFGSAATVKNMILVALDTIPGFRKARQDSDIKTMAALYRTYVIQYIPRDKEKYSRHGQAAFFYEVGGLSGLMNNASHYFDKMNSPALLIKFVLPDLIDPKNPDALDPIEAERYYWNDPENARYHIFRTLDTVPGFKDARERGDIKAMVALYRKNVIQYKAKDTEKYKCGGQLTFFHEVGGLSGLMADNRPYLQKRSSGASLIRFVLPGIIDLTNSDALDPTEVEHDYWTDPDNAKYHTIKALDTIPQFKEAREKGDIKVMADLYRVHVIKYRSKDTLKYANGGQTAFFYEVGRLSGLLANPRSYLAKTNSPASLLRLSLPGLIDEDNAYALKSREVENIARPEADSVRDRLIAKPETLDMAKEKKTKVFDGVVTAQGSDDKEIEIYFDTKGVLRSINDLAKEVGLKIYFAGGTARNMLLGKTEFVDRSDIDVAVRRPYTDIEADDMRSKIVAFKDHLKQKYPDMVVDIINLDKQGDLFEGWYEKFEGSRVATVSRMLVGEDGDKWFVSSGDDEGYIQDVREKILRLVPGTDKFGISYSPSMDSVLRFVRLRAEFHELRVDEASEREVNKFVSDNFDDLDNELGKLENVAARNRTESQNQSFDNLVKALAFSKNPYILLQLLKITGVGGNNLYNLLRKHLEIEEVETVFLRSRIASYGETLQFESGEGVLFIGESESGKSTLAVKLLESDRKWKAFSCGSSTMDIDLKDRNPVLVGVRTSDNNVIYSRLLGNREVALSQAKNIRIRWIVDMDGSFNEFFDRFKPLNVSPEDLGIAVIDMRDLDAGRDSGTCIERIRNVILSPKPESPDMAKEKDVFVEPDSIAGVFNHLCRRGITSEYTSLNALEIAESMGVPHDILEPYVVELLSLNLCVGAEGTGKDAKYYVPEQIKKKSEKLLLVLRSFNAKGFNEESADVTREKINTIIESAKEYDEKFLRVYQALINIFLRRKAVPVDITDAMKILYSPGVGKACEAIERNPGLEPVMYGDTAKKLKTEKRKVVIFSDGSAVLGYGVRDCPFMRPVSEGKRILLKWFGGINVDIGFIYTYGSWLKYKRSKDLSEQKTLLEEIENKIIDEVKDYCTKVREEEGFDTVVMLEDISAPVCFGVEKRLNEAGISTIHDDQHGTAIVFAGAMLRAAKETERDISKMRITIAGAGASATAVTNLLHRLGFGTDKANGGSIIVCDTRGVLYRGRPGMTPEKDALANYNLTGFKGKIEDALKGSSAFVGLSSPGSLWGREELFKSMEDNAIVFLGSNPTPEADPAIIKNLPNVRFVGMGAFGYPQGSTLNNSYSFPAIFRALRDAKDLAKFNIEEVEKNAAVAISELALTEEELSSGILLPPTFKRDDNGKWIFNTDVFIKVLEKVFEGLGERLDIDEVLKDIQSQHEAVYAALTGPEIAFINKINEGADIDTLQPYVGALNQLPEKAEVYKKTSPVGFLQAIKENELLMKNATDKAIGIKIEDVVNTRGGYLNYKSMASAFRFLRALDILVPVDGKRFYYRFSDKFLGPDQDYTNTLLNAAADVKYQLGKRGDDRPLHRSGIPAAKIKPVRELIKMAILHQVNIEKRPAIADDRTLWHIIEEGVIPLSQRATIVTQINKAFRDTDLSEKILILEDGKSIKDAIEEIRSNDQSAVIDIALSSEQHIDGVPDDKAIKMLVFKNAKDYIQLEGVVAALRALHSQDALPTLLRLYSIMAGQPFNNPPDGLSDDPKQFALRLIFDLPEAAKVPADEIPKLNERLIQLLIAA